LRILYQSNGFLPSLIGGVEVLSYHLLRALAARGHDVLAISECRQMDQLGRRTYDGIDLVQLAFAPTMASRSFSAMRQVHAKVAEVVVDFRPDMLHLNDTGLGSLFFLRGGATGHIPRILTLHSPVRAAGDLGLQGRMAMDVDHVVAVSQSIHDDLLAAVPALGGRISLIRNALPMPDEMPADLPFAPPTLLCLGRVVREKGFHVAVRAFALLRGRGVAARLLIAGNGDEKSRLEAMAAELGVAGDISFLDWVMPDRVPALINGATLVLMPSRWPEPFGLVALQAAQMGRPVVASKAGGLPEIVDHGVTGLLFGNGDEAALADAVQALLADEPLARRMGVAARERASRKFDFAALVDGYERAYALAAARPGSRDRAA
jgi:glycogen(starch) synthase